MDPSKSFNIGLFNPYLEGAFNNNFNLGLIQDIISQFIDLPLNRFNLLSLGLSDFLP